MQKANHKTVEENCKRGLDFLFEMLLMRTKFVSINRNVNQVCLVWKINLQLGSVIVLFQRVKASVFFSGNAEHIANVRNPSQPRNPGIRGCIVNKKFPDSCPKD